jgi:hypothetical protein
MESELKIIKISKKALETFGSNSLEGHIMNEFNELPKELRIEFEQTSIGWRREHGGPDSIIIPEFVPMVLCESILYLSQYCRLEIGEYN